MTAITATAIAAMPVDTALQDGTVPGLSIRRHKSGYSWTLYYRTKPTDRQAQKERRLKVGAYPLVSIARARAIAREKLVVVAQGRDPQGERKAADKAPDLDALWLLCETQVYGTGTAWAKEAKRHYHSNVKPRLGRVKVAELAYPQVRDMHAAMAAKPFEANRTLSVLGRMLQEAERLEMRPAGSNPCRLVKRYPERKRKRYATAAEITEIGPVLDEFAKDPEHVSGVAFLYIMLFSGARPSEVANGTPDMIERVEGGAGVLRLEKGKTGARDVFLPPQAMAVIDKLPADRGRLAGRMGVPRRLWKKVREKTGCGDLWARDLRRTFATVAMSNGVPIGVVGELLGHKSTQTTKIYAKLMEDPAHAAAAAIAGRMQTLLGKTDETSNPVDEPAAGDELRRP